MQRDTHTGQLEQKEHCNKDSQGAALLKHKEGYLECVYINPWMTEEIMRAEGAVWGLMVRGRSVALGRTPSG